MVALNPGKISSLGNLLTPFNPERMNLKIRKRVRGKRLD